MIKTYGNPVKWLFSKIVLWSKSIFALKKSDIIFAFHPKTGSTWVRIFFYNLFSGENKSFTFMDVNKAMPEFGNPIHSLASWYTFRELDVQISLDKYLQSKHGIPFMKQHYNFLRNNKKAREVSYEQMKENPMFTILNLSQKLDLGINPSRLEYVLENFDRQEQIKVEKNEGRTDLHKNFSTPKNYSHIIDQIAAYQDEDLKVILADYQNYHQNSLR